MKTERKLVFAGVSAIVMLAFAWFVLDVNIHRSDRVTGEGVIIHDDALLARYQKSFTDANVPYRVVERDNGVHFLWQEKDSVKAKSIESLLITGKPGGWQGICSSTLESRELIKKKLVQLSIAHKLYKNDSGMPCISWPKSETDRINDDSINQMLSLPGSPE